MDITSGVLSQSLDLPSWSDPMTENEEALMNTDDWELRPILGIEGRSAVEDLGVPQWRPHTEDLWGSVNHTSQEYATRGSAYTSGVAERDPEADHETMERIWNHTVEVSGIIWKKLEPLLTEYMPEDKNPFWVCGVVILVFFLALAALRIDFKRGAETQKTVILPPIKSPHVTLPDGRRLAYREQGVSQDIASHTILVVHGFPSSRLAGIPGVKHSLLKEFGVRLIAFDRPGFGESDMHLRRSLRSSAQDMASIADALGAGEKFWVLGYSTGGIHAWAAMKYIPERLAGVALFAPGGNFYAPNMTKQESARVWGNLTLRRRVVYMLARWIPSLLPSILKGTFIKKIDKLPNDFLVTAGKDQELLLQKIFLDALVKDIEESVRQGNAATLAHEFVLQVRSWGFHLSDFRIRKKVPPSGLLHFFKSYWKKEEEEWEGFSAPIHIWQGTEDQMVPLAINEFAVRMVPQAVLHKMEGEGHYSYFWFCDRCHREIFTILFKKPEDVKVSVAPEDLAPVMQSEQLRRP